MTEFICPVGICVAPLRASAYTNYWRAGRGASMPFFIFLSRHTTADAACVLGAVV
jgi:hypothetical protein